MTGGVLGYEAQYSGQAVLVRGEGQVEVEGRDGVVVNSLQPATIDIVSSKGKCAWATVYCQNPRASCRPTTPRAPTETVLGRIVSIYGSASVLNARQNQVVALNKGRADGMEAWHGACHSEDGRRAWSTATTTGPNSSCLMSATAADGISQFRACLLRAHS